MTEQLINDAADIPRRASTIAPNACQGG